jgi:outer membrane protein TolC
LVTIPLFSGFDTIARTRAQSLLVQAQERSQRQLEFDVAAALNTLRFKFQELTDLNNLNDRQLSSARRYYDLTLGEYRRGIKNSPDVVTATERWFSAQKRNLELKRDFENLRSQIEGYFSN